MHTTGISREQVRLASWEDFVPSDSPARQIDRFVDEMDTSYFLFSSHDSVGRRPYNPKDRTNVSEQMGGGNKWNKWGTNGDGVICCKFQLTFLLEIAII